MSWLPRKPLSAQSPVCAVVRHQDLPDSPAWAFWPMGTKGQVASAECCWARPWFSNWLPIRIIWIFKTTPGRSHPKTTDSEPLRVGPGIHLFEAPQVISGPDRDEKGLENEAWSGAACSEDQLEEAQGPLPTAAHNPQPTPCKRPSLTSVYMLQPPFLAPGPQASCPWLHGLPPAGRTRAGPGQACSGHDPRAWPHCSEIMKGPLPCCVHQRKEALWRRWARRKKANNPHRAHSYRTYAAAPSEPLYLGLIYSCTTPLQRTKSLSPQCAPTTCQGIMDSDPPGYHKTLSKW